MLIRLRRFPGEPVCIVGGTVDAVTDVVATEAVEDQEGDWCRWPSTAAALCYSVRLGSECRVRAVDWRRFSSSPDMVADAIARCVSDNAAPLRFEPRTEEALRTLREGLKCALADLSSIADAIQSECDFDGDVLCVDVIYESKTGQRHSVSWRLSLA